MDAFDVPDSRNPREFDNSMADFTPVLPNEASYEQHITPQKNDYQVQAQRNKTSFNTQMKTIDTINRGSNVKEQYHLYRTPSSLDNMKIDRFNSNVKQTNSKMYDAQHCQPIHLTG